ncbi:MAG TPA: hypothetical protein DIS98_03620 [Colwellia sp.]|nr:hypothetical protein [Colwellia sp.]
MALIEKEGDLQNNTANYRSVNQNVLSRIQALRNSHNITEKTNSQAITDSQSYTFVYNLYNKQLNYDDKIRIISLLVNKNKTFIINIAPAQGANTLDQLALSIARAEALRQYINHFNKRVTIKFAPKLSPNTINLVIGT